MNKINNIQLSEIENKKEQLWFSIIKQISSETNFGSVELNLTIKNGEITNISKIRVKESFNIQN